MMYFIKKGTRKRPAHYWTGDDTFCRMASTGGLNKDRYDVIPAPDGRSICAMCQSVASRSEAAE